MKQIILTIMITSLYFPVASSQDIDILDAIQTYTQSEDEESSQEIQFSLILPSPHGEPSALTLC